MNKQNPPCTGAQTAARMHIGWNLGNTLDSFAPDKGLAAETAWFNPPVTRQVLQAVAFLQANDFHGLVLLDDTTLHTTGSNGATAGDGEHVLDGHQEGQLVVTGRSATTTSSIIV